MGNCQDWPVAMAQAATIKVPHNMVQAMVSITLPECSRTFMTSALPAVLEMVATSARIKPSRKCPLPPPRISCSAAPMDW